MFIFFHFFFSFFFMVLFICLLTPFFATQTIFPCNVFIVIVIFVCYHLWSPNMWKFVVLCIGKSPIDGSLNNRLQSYIISGKSISCCHVKQLNVLFVAEPIIYFFLEAISAESVFNFSTNYQSIYFINAVA